MSRLQPLSYESFTIASPWHHAHTSSPTKHHRHRRHHAYFILRIIVSICLGGRGRTRWVVFEVHVVVFTSSSSLLPSSSPSSSSSVVNMPTVFRLLPINCELEPSAGRRLHLQRCERWPARPPGHHVRMRVLLVSVDITTYRHTRTHTHTHEYKYKYKHKYNLYNICITHIYTQYTHIHLHTHLD